MSETSVDAIAATDYECSGASSRYWRGPGQAPAQPSTAIIAILADDGLGWLITPGLWMATPDGWRHEQTGEPLDEAEYLWMPETALLEELEVPA